MFDVGSTDSTAGTAIDASLRWRWCKLDKRASEPARTPSTRAQRPLEYNTRRTAIATHSNACSSSSFCARDTPSRMLTMPPRHAPLASSNSTNSTSALFFHLRSTRVVIYNIYSILYVHVQLVRAQRRIECALDTHSNSLTGPTAYPAIDWIVVFYTATSSSASSWG